METEYRTGDIAEFNGSRRGGTRNKYAALKKAIFDLPEGKYLIIPYSDDFPVTEKSVAGKLNSYGKFWLGGRLHSRRLPDGFAVWWERPTGVSNGGAS